MRLPVTSQRKAAFRALAATLFVAGLAVCLAAWASPLAAAGPHAPLAAMTVNTLDDELNSDGDCSLREAIEAANTDLAVDACPAGSDGDTITFDPALVAGGPQTLTLTLFDPGLDADEFGPTALDVTTAITLTGPGGENGLTLQRDSGGPAFRLFRVSLEGELTLENLTLRGGLAQGGDGAKRGGGADGLGGAIYNEGILRLVACTLTGNQASGGNGAYGYDNEGGGGGGGGAGGEYLNPGGAGGFGGGGGQGRGNAVPGAAGGFGGGGGGERSGPAGSGGFGGGDGGTYYGGGGGGLGGVIFNRKGTVEITNSTLSGNTASGGDGGDNGGSGSGGGSGLGGGLFTLDGTVVVQCSTLAGNGVTAGTGYVAGSAAGGAIYTKQDVFPATLTLRGAILADTLSWPKMYIRSKTRRSGRVILSGYWG